jgi:hypothetical protein
MHRHPAFSFAYWTSLDRLHSSLSLLGDEFRFPPVAAPFLGKTCIRFPLKARPKLSEGRA